MPSQAVLKLNSVNYPLEPFEDGQFHIQRIRAQEFFTPFTTDQQLTTNIAPYKPAVFPNFSKGFGRDRIDSDSANNLLEYRRFWDATIDTRWASGTYLPILEEDSGLVANDQVLRASVNFRNNAIALWEHFDSPNYKVFARFYDGSATDWAAMGGAGGQVRTSTNPVVARDIIATANGLAALLAETNDINCYISTDQGQSWAIATTNITANLLSDSVTANEDIDIGLYVNIGGVLLAAVWHEANATVTFFSSADGGDNWTDRSADIITSNGPQGIAVLAGIDNEDKVYLALAEGLYELDTADLTAITSRLIFPMEPHSHNGRNMKVADDGSLWFAQGVDNDTPPIVYRMTIANGERRIEQVPNDFSTGDGLPSDMLGTIRFMLPAKGMMYAALGGGVAGRQARIVAHNGDGWHSMRKHGTANQQILWMAASPHDNDVSRLHYTVLTASTTATAHFLAQPFANPASGISIKRETSGYIDLPWIDGGLALDSKNWLRVGINAHDLAATASTNDHINVDSAVSTDLGARTARGSFSDLGDFLSGGSRVGFPKNGNNEGLSGLALALRVNLLRETDTNTNTPVLKDVQIDYFPVLTPTREFIFQVNLTEARKILTTDQTTPFTNLQAAESSVTLVPLTYGDLGTIYVRVLPIEYREKLRNNSVPSSPAGASANDRRDGIAIVKAIQPV